jgi:hypothetical protein
MNFVTPKTAGLACLLTVLCVQVEGMFAQNKPSFGTLIQEERWAEALPLLEARAANRVENFYRQYLLGVARYHTGALPEAKSPLLVAAGFSQVKEYASAYLARLYAKLGEGGIAMQWLTRARKAGYPEFQKLKDDEAFLGLKDNRIFISLLEDWETELRFQFPVNHPDYISPWHPWAAKTRVRTEAVVVPNWTGGLALGPSGELYIGTFGSELHVMDRTGAIRLFADGFKVTSGIAVDKNGFVYQADFGDAKVYKISPDGSERSVYADENLVGPVGMVFDSKGNLFVVNCDGGSVARITPDGTSTIFARSPLFYCTNGITINERDELFIVNYHDGNLLKVLPDGSVHFVAEAPSRNNAHAVYVDGNLFVTANKEGRLYIVDEMGRYRILAGSGKKGIIDGLGFDAGFSAPNGITYDPETHELIVNDLFAGPVLDPDAPVTSSARIRRIKLPAKEPNQLYDRAIKRP